jgi:hypothetical protein
VPASLSLPGANSGSADAIPILHERHAQRLATSQTASVVPNLHRQRDPAV